MIQTVNSIQPVINILSQDITTRFFTFLDVSQVSVRSYVSGIKQFISFIHSQNVTAPTRDTIIEFKKYLLNSGKKPATIAMYLSALRRFFDWCDTESLYPNITAGVKSPKQDTGHKRDALSATQLKACLQGISRDSLEGLRNYAIFALVSTTGLRTVEVVRANVEDIRYVQGVPCLFVQGKGRNSKSEFVKLSEPVMQAVTEYLTARGQVQDDAPLFASCSRRNKGQRLTTRTVSAVCKRAMVTAGYNSRRLTAHSLRHSAVTLALMAGMSLQDVCAFARHKSISTTMLYSHDIERLKSQCENAVTAAIFAA